MQKSVVAVGAVVGVLALGAGTGVAQHLLTGADIQDGSLTATRAA